MEDTLLKVAFICVHNSCRSQIAEALGRYFAFDVFESYSAGTTIKDKINQDAVRLIKKHYQIDMEETQYTKCISDLPCVDIIITMGCHVQCPTIHAKYMEDWGLPDPTGQTDEVFIDLMKTIQENILNLKNDILKGNYTK